MMLAIASALAFVAVGGVVYVGFVQFYPVIRAHVESDYLNTDRTLKSIFYTAYDARLFVTFKYGGALVALLVGVFLFKSLVFGLFMGLIAYWIPGVLLAHIVRARRDALERQTGDVMVALDACIKSGMTLEESIAEIATAMRPPVAQEFAIVKDRIDSGETIVSALRAADTRVQVPRLSLVFQSIIVSQQRGGRLATLMERLSEATREIERVEERVKTETSGLLLSARIMVFMPLIIGGFLYFADPGQVTMLFNTVPGNVILVLAIGMDILAFRIMKKLIDLEV